MPVKVIDHDRCMRLLKQAVYGRLATCGADGQPYITPVNFVIYNEKIYFHTGFQGRKLDNIHANQKVCFEISGSGKIYAPKHAKEFTMRYWSVLVFGSAKAITNEHVKIEVMNEIMKKYAHHYEYEPLSLPDMGIVNVIEISMSEVSGKASIDPIQ